MFFKFFSSSFSQIFYSTNIPGNLASRAEGENPLVPSGPFGDRIIIIRGPVSSKEATLRRDGNLSMRAAVPSLILTTLHPDDFPLRCNTIFFIKITKKRQNSFN